MYWGAIGGYWVCLCPGTAGVHSAGLKANRFLVCKSSPEKGLKSLLNRRYRHTHGASSVLRPPSVQLSLCALKCGDLEGVGARPKLCSSKHSCFPVKKHRFCPGCFVKTGSFPPLPVPQDLSAGSDTCLFSAPFFLPAVIPHSDQV